MNKSLISVLTIGTFFVSGAFAEDVVIDTPNAWNYSNIFTTEADYNMYYTGAESQPVKFGALNSDKNYVLKSLTLKPAGTSISGQTSTNPSIWYAASNYTFNVDAVSGEDVVFSNETTAAFQHLVGTSMTIQKAEGNEDSTAVAVINGGNAQFNIDVGGGSAPASLYVLANTNFKTNLGTKTASVIGGGSTITVGNNSTFTTNGVMYYKDGTDTKKSGLVVDEGSIYTANNQTIFGTYSQSNINGTFANYATVEMRANSSVYIKNLNHGGGHTFYINNGTLTVDNVWANGFAQMNITGANASVTYTKADKTLLTRTINISTGAKFVTAGYLYIKGLDKSFASGAAYATITINEGSKILVDDPTTPRVLLDNGEIVFNQANAITTSTGEFVRLASIKDDDTLDDAILRINASQTFRGVHAVGSNIDIYLSTEVAATFDSQEGYATTDGAFIIIHNFQEERIFVGDIFKDGVLTNNANDVFKAFQTIDGNEVQIENLYINNGFLSAAVPEPAEWAAIFGAIALGLAIYRRRK